MLVWAKTLAFGGKMPTDCFVLRTLTILPTIRISQDYHPAFMLMLGAGPKVIRSLTSKLVWAKTLAFEV